MCVNGESEESTCDQKWSHGLGGCGGRGENFFGQMVSAWLKQCIYPSCIHKKLLHLVQQYILIQPHSQRKYMFISKRFRESRILAATSSEYLLIHLQIVVRNGTQVTEVDGTGLRSNQVRRRNDTSAAALWCMQCIQMTPLSRTWDLDRQRRFDNLVW